ncbi:MAG: hypothetical protein K2X99_04735 [Gemmatimonadaceae bacterium]|nr:hypothetical protein [Gemmatimonadaceae bacterium]
MRVEGQEQRYPLGSHHLEAIVGHHLNDLDVLADLYLVALKHPSSAVRRSALSHDGLPFDAVETLADDSSTAVRLALSSHPAFRRGAPEEMILALAESDPDIAESVAGNVESFENADTIALCTSLAQHPDPAVRRALALNSGTPISWVRHLAKDESPDVAQAASQALLRRRR